MRPNCIDELPKTPRERKRGAIKKLIVDGVHLHHQAQSGRPEGQWVQIFYPKYAKQPCGGDFCIQVSSLLDPIIQKMTEVA